MTDRPSGTVTFLFTDIEGSTQLWENRSDWMAKAHARHESILRDAFAAHGGYPYKMIGDAFQVAFSSAPSAVAAAIDAQRALAAEPWGDAEIRVRMALHSGETEERDDDYVGPLLNRAARLMSAGHGGQVLLSQTTYDLVRDRLSPAVGLRDLGERRLRDLNRPERVHQVVVPGLPQDFPPLKTLDALPNNLPVQLTHFIGRERPMAEIAQLLARSRLVTLTGSGGSGKTRLALQLGGELLDTFAHGVWFVGLAPIADERGVPQAVATALGIQEIAGRPVLEAVTARIADEERLVILDNCEHLMRASAETVSSLLRASPRSKVLVTSREPLRIAGESTYRVPSLETPEPRDGPTAATLAQSEAVRLFADRAASVSSSFVLTDTNVPIVAEICRRLDGIPLAIELAAARVATLSLDKIAERLSDRFRLLARGDRLALPRQQTLRALIDWSHELLTEPERVLLRRLAAFAGGWSLDSTEAVCAGGDVDEADVLDLLANLVEKSLVVLEPGGERYRLLETIREYALERLRAAGEESEVRERHLARYLALAERATGTAGAGGDTEEAWLAVDIDYENLMAVHTWCEAPGHAEQGLRLVVALGHYWRHRGLLDQGQHLTLQALARPGAEGRTPLRCKALYELARLTFSMGRYTEAEEATRGSLEIAREIGADDSASLALRYLGGFELLRGNPAVAVAHCAEAIAIARGLTDRMPLYAALQSMAELHRHAGDLDLAEPLYEEVLVFNRAIRDPASISIQLLNLAMLHVTRGTPDRAIDRIDEAVTIAVKAGLKMACQVALDTCAGLAAARAEWAVAARLYGASASEHARTNFQLDPTDDAFLAPLVARARGALGEAVFASLEAEGRNLAYEDALAEARRWVAGLRRSPGG